MPFYPAYTTTVVGAHSVPRWYEALDRLVTLGQLSPGDFADAQFRAMQAAILEQEMAGIDVITGGEMHRRTHNRHSPPNAMLNYFWQKIPAFQGANRPKSRSRRTIRTCSIRPRSAAARSIMRPILGSSTNSRPSRRSRASRSRSP